MRIAPVSTFACAALLLVSLIAGCSSDNPVSDQPQEIPPPTFVVDTELEPIIPSLPGFKAGEVRPLGCILSPDGLQAEFVANEIWISTNDQSVIDQVVAQLDAEIVSELVTEDAALSALPKQTLLRFDPSAVDAEGLVAALADLGQDSTGEHRVSSTDALGLFAAATNIALDGVDVGVNWVPRNASIVNRESNEAPTGPGQYEQNAFLWDTHSVGSNQDIGVAEAWRGLELAGKTDNKIKLAILDQGFEFNEDTPDGAVAIPNIPFRPALGERNLFNCSGGDPCDWHGTNVLSAAMAVPDDGFGGAGPAGQIAEPIIVSTTGDMFMSIRALTRARTAGARIANMSYGVPVPSVLFFTVLPFEAATFLLRETGMLIFAAAGNDGENVDAETCLGICWENTWWTPCENAGVICVGGLFANTRDRANGSNYGKKQVDIFAPFTVYVGPDPDFTENHIRALSGTSFSSPFAAGVAAMIWAADPGMSADQVENILMQTAHSSGDDQVNRSVNALAGVRAALGNAPPLIDIFGNTEITRPLNQEVRMSVTVSDFEDGNSCCVPTWVSDVDGDLGSGLNIQHVFTTEGLRRITISATDSEGALSQEFIDLTIENSAPRVAIAKPTTGETVFANVPYTLKGSAVDINEPGAVLDCNALVWTSTISGDQFPVTGCEPTVTFNSLGTWGITLTGTDPQGRSDFENVLVTVIAPPSNLPPVVNITSPQNGSAVNIFEELSLTGNATDPEGNNPVTFEWSVNWGLGKVVIGTGPSMTWVVSETIPPDCGGRWNIQLSLRATDSFGQSAVDSVNLTANFICRTEEAAAGVWRPLTGRDRR